MDRGSPIPPMLRPKIVEQYQKGVSQRKIAKSLKLSSSTVHNIIQRFRESGTISVRKGRGRKTILDARDLRALRRHCITYRNATVMEITTWAQEYFQKTLSVNTIHRAIRCCRLKLYRSKKKPYLNMIQKRRRFLWAKAHLKWTVAKWKTVLWSDQSKFEVLFGKLGRHVIRTKEDKDNPSCYQRSVQKPASLMVWGCMSACGMGSLHIWKSTINAESSLMNATVYEVRALLKSRDSAFRAGDKAALRTARAKLSQAIREAKRTHAHGHFQDSGDSRRMWQGIQEITNYKTTPSACDSDASLPDALNDFYARFEAQNNVAARKTTPPPNDQVLCLSTADVKITLCRVNSRKSAEPDNIPGRVLRECAEQLADVFTDIFNISLSSAVVPTCLKTTTIVPVPKKSTVSCLNDYRPIALTPIVMKCFERLVMRHSKTQIPPSLDPLQFAYHPNCYTDDAITTTLHLSLTHLDNKDTWRLQPVRIGNSFSSTTTLSTGAPGCVLSPLLFTLLTHDCAAMHSSNHIVKFTDDATVVGLISKNDESAYREEVQRLTAWCKANNLSLNVDKTKEMVVDFRRAQSDHSPLFIDGSPVEIVKSTKFLGVHLAENLTTSSISKKAQQHLYFLRRLRKAHLPPPILTMFYRGTIESVLSTCITAWFGNCTVSDCKTLQRIVRTAEKIIGVSLPSITDMYTTRCIRKANSIVDDPTHPSHTHTPHTHSSPSCCLERGMSPYKVTPCLHHHFWHLDKRERGAVQGVMRALR
ncbi:hypothetical protein QTP70_010002 [Hemibagrus guttatus]|uniref:Paired domain-containing protein n=1 Tax=Hemibagrus guttatus TaxID=175788 RepID=A0AAE0PU68_9TELE|nr:hypothetical protein QTP70_010002 [Hemibagrus guttatus]